MVGRVKAQRFAKGLRRTVNIASFLEPEAAIIGLGKCVFAVGIHDVPDHVSRCSGKSNRNLFRV